MTVMPVAAPAAPSSSNAPAAGAGGGAEFADLVQQHLGDGGLDRDAATAVLDEAASPTAAPSDGLAALLAGLVAGTASNAPAGTAASAAQTTAAEPATAETSEGSGAAPAVTEAEAALVGVAGPQPGAAGPGTVATGVGAATGQAVVASQAVVATGAVQLTGAGQGTIDQPAADAAANGAGDATAVVADLATDGSAADADGNAGERAAGGAAAITQASAGTSGGAAAGAASATGGVSRVNPITDQVFDHVTRLVSRGDGTHRITLRLHPADLGEVKVVLTVKDGTVDVTLAAGAHAREALREGSPQLRSLLELTGATTGQVVIRDLSGSPVSAAAQQQALGNAPDQGQQQPTDGGDAAVESRDGFGDGSADASRDDRGADGGVASGADGSRRTSHLVGRAADDAASADAAGSRRTTLFIPSRVDLNL